MKNNYNLKARLILALTCLFTSFSAIAQVDVVATAGTPIASYTTLDAAFAAINAGTHMGAIGIGISANSTEVGACVLNSSGAGAASYTSVLISPTVDGVTISGPTVTGRGLIELNGADNVTIDGDNPNTGGTNRNLTIVNTAVNTVTFTSVIRVAVGTAAPYLDNNNISVKNLILNGSATSCNSAALIATTGAQNNTFGIVAGPFGGVTPSPLINTTTPINASAFVNTFMVDNCAINQAGRGIAFLGNGATSSTGIALTNNTIGGAGVLGTYPFTTPDNTVYSQGMFITGSNAVTVTGNTIQNILSYISTTSNGIVLNSGIGAGAINISNNTITAVTNNGTVSAANGIAIGSAVGSASLTISGNTISNIQNNANVAIAGIQITSSSATNVIISNNKVSTVWARFAGAGSGARGILLGSGSNVTVRNNMISDINICPNNSAVSTTLGARGINITTGSGHKIYNNTVSLSGPVIPSVNNDITTCLGISSAALTGIDVRNNIFSNTMSGGSATTPHVCLQLPTGATSAMNLTLKNNAYYSGSAPGQSGILVTTASVLYTAANFIASATAPATNSRSYTSTLSASGTNDNASYASVNAAPFLSATDLHLNTASAELPNVEQKGDASVPVTVDIDGNVRPNASTTLPDMGADEVVAPACVSSNGGTITPAAFNSCVGLTATLTSTGASFGTGISYQWMTSTVSGGPYSNVVGGTGATTTAYTSGALTAGTFYYVLQVTCTAGPSTGLSNEVTVTVNGNPTVTVSPLTATLCMPGATAVALTASGASTYAWGPAPGLSATTGTSVNALPAATTTYTVTGTDVNGCIATATSAITISSSVIISSITATPSSVCSGGNSTLAVSASTGTVYCNPTYSTGTGAGDYITNVTLGTINNTTGASATPYSTYYSALSTNLTAGSPYTVTGTINNGGTEDIAIWTSIV